MIVQMIAQYQSLGRDDAVKQAEERWQEFLGDPLATLPWSTTLNVLYQPDKATYQVDLLVKDAKAEGSVLTSGG